MQSAIGKVEADRALVGQMRAVRDDDEDGVLAAMEIEQHRGHVVG